MKLSNSKIYFWNLKLLFLILFVLSLLLLSSCAKKECSVDSDCTAKTCGKATCSEENTCKYELTANCCGNLKCEITAAENSCNCEIDCKPKCEGNVVLGKKGKTDLFSKYLEQKCVGQKKASVCESKIIEQFTIPQTIVNEIKVSDIKLGITSTFAKAMNPEEMPFKISLELKDAPNTVILPVTITTISLVSGQKLLGKRNVNQEFSYIGESIVVNIPFSFTPSLIEEEKQVSVKIELEYLKKTSSGNILQRLNAEEKIGEKIVFVK